MTKAEALYEIAELASSLIHASQPDADTPPELFNWCELLKDEALGLGNVSGTAYSADYTKADEWLREKRKA